MKIANLFLLLCLLVSNSVSGQSRFGIEFKEGVVKTYNEGKIESGGGGFYYYKVTKERDPVTYDYSFGLVYRLNDRNLIKLHFGRHHNGRILDITNTDDVGSTNYFSNINKPNRYFQVTPSYAYRIISRKWIIPIELGLNINRVDDINIFIVDINPYNFDLELTAGAQYRFTDNFMVGLHGLYSRFLNEYQDKRSVNGAFRPVQIGLELSMAYELGKHID